MISLVTPEIPGEHFWGKFALQEVYPANLAAMCMWKAKGKKMLNLDAMVDWL